MCRKRKYKLREENITTVKETVKQNATRPKEWENMRNMENFTART